VQSDFRLLLVMIRSFELQDEVVHRGVERALHLVSKIFEVALTSADFVREHEQLL